MDRSRPNVLLVTIDALRADALGCYGYPAEMSRNIDRVASRGLRFEVAISNGDHTRSAFPAIMSSTYASMYSGCLGSLSPQRPTLAKSLQQSGYWTVGVSTSPLVSTDLDYDRGFGTFVDVPPPDIGARWYNRKGGQRLLQQELTHCLLRPLGVDTRPVPPYAPAADAVEVLLQSLDEVRRPFMVWLHLMDVHWPYHINAELEGCRELAQSWRDVRMMHVVSSSSAEPPAGWLDHVRLLYHAAIRRADAVIGRLLRDLRQRGWLENTVVALTSDHGEEFLEHGGLGHANKRLYEEIIRVPLIVAGPGICQGAVSQPVQLLDLAPTLLDLAQVDVPPDMLGRSLTPLLTGRSMAPSLPIISEMWWEDWVLLSARTDRHKLLWRPKMPDDYRFFDLASDPGEQVNVQGSAPRVEEDLLQSIRDHMGSVREGQEDAASVDLDQAVQDRLVALGYLEM